MSDQNKLSGDDKTWIISFALVLTFILCLFQIVREGRVKCVYNDEERPPVEMICSHNYNDGVDKKNFVYKLEKN